jgi:hypothetical protein
MLSAEKQTLLSGFLGQLPESVAAQLAKAVEADRLTGGTVLPHDGILRALRPQLRLAPQPKRLPTPQRYFCLPFEDILVPPERSTKQKGRIARSSIEPVWNWLGAELMPARLRELSDVISKALLHKEDDALHDASAELWAEAAEALKPALSSEKKKAIAAKKLGGMAIAEDAAEMALLLGGAQDVQRLQRLLPKPIDHLNDHDIALMREVFDRWTHSDPDLAPYVPLILLGRLERPCEALRAAAALSRKTNDTLISSTDLGTVGELLLSDLEEHVKAIQAARPVDFDADALLVNLAGFAELSSGVVKEMGIRREGKWGQQLVKDRTTVATIVEELLDRATKEILGVLPLAKAFGQGSKPFDYSRGPDPERKTRAIRYARVLAGSQPFAVACAFNVKLKDVLEETTNMLRSFSEELLREHRSAPETTRANVDAQLDAILEICAIVLGDEETSLLRRRAKVPATA